jgi:hypothetical protein
VSVLQETSSLGFSQEVFNSSIYFLYITIHNPSIGLPFANQMVRTQGIVIPIQQGKRIHGHGHGH